MANNDRNQQRNQTSSRGRTGGPRPWNVYYPRQYSVQGEREPETRTDFMRVGTAFPLKDGKEGLSIEIQLPLQLEPGQRLIAMPRDDGNDSGGERR